MKKPVIGFVADWNDFWEDVDLFKSTIRRWKYRLGVEHALMLSGNFARFEPMLDIAVTEGVKIACGSPENTDDFLGGAGPDTQDEADRIVEPIATILSSYSCIETIVVTDEPTVENLSRLKKLVIAYRKFVPTTVTVTSTVIGIGRAGLLHYEAGLDQLLLTTYPCALGVQGFRMDGCGFPGPIHEYVRQIQSEALIPDNSVPLWTIAQAHDSQQVGLRRPLLSEITGQYEEAWKLGAERVYWFAWPDRLVESYPGDATWNGIVSLPEYQKAIAECDAVFGVPNVPPDYQETVEQWFERHPLYPEGQNYKSKILPPFDADEVVVHANDDWTIAVNGTPTEGRLIFLEGSHPGTRFLKSNVYVHGVPGTNPEITGLLELAPCVEASNYVNWMSMLKWDDELTSLGVKARDVFNSYRIKNWHIKDVKLNGNGGLLNIVTRTAEGIILEDCELTNIIMDVADPSSHRGHWSGHAALFNLWRIRCKHSGNGIIEGDVIRTQNYWDGAHGSGDIECEYIGDRNSAGVLLQITNDDANADYNRNGVLDPPEVRLARYNVSYRAKVGNNLAFAGYTGSDNLVDRLELEPGATLSECAMYLDSRPPKRFPNVPYAFVRNVIRRSKIKPTSTFWVVITRGSTDTEHPDPTIGQNEIKDVIIDEPGFNRWFKHTGAEQIKVGPDVLENVATSGEIPSPTSWMPEQYAYLPLNPIPLIKDSVVKLEVEVTRLKNLLDLV